jgi:hypothetical protein
MLAWVDEQLAALSVLVGFPADQLAMVLCLLINYPLGFLFLRLLGQPNSPTAGDAAFRSSSSSSPSSAALAVRHLYSIVPSVLFGVWLFGWDLLHSLVSSLVGYAILLALARSSSCGKIMFVYAMAYVAASHIYRHDSPWPSQTRCADLATRLRVVCRVCAVVARVWCGS